MRWNPPPKPPRGLADQLFLHPHERVLASARASSGEWYVGTNLALHLPVADASYRRVGWESLERAEWRRDSEQLAIVETAPWGEPEHTTLVRMDEPGRLLELLRERVTKSIVCSLYARVGKRAGLTVVGRRSPTGDGPIAWSYVLSRGLDPADPEVVRVAEETLEQARQEVVNL